VVNGHIWTFIELSFGGDRVEWGRFRITVDSLVEIMTISVRHDSKQTQTREISLFDDDPLERNFDLEL